MWMIELARGGAAVFPWEPNSSRSGQGELRLSLRLGRARWARGTAAAGVSPPLWCRHSSRPSMPPLRDAAAPIPEWSSLAAVAVAAGMAVAQGRVRQVVLRVDAGLKLGADAVQESGR
ncbi:hypothetical protein Vretimale_15111 [Volvox reticuliferus]|uniref:Uncharacterized protein n=1 Tax=Volvox reticuliferus TaxID=1737510 RepID=A0A8J4GNG3_9CHLO|nr:hypothetical protein Vretimale_15111 [Volvox reticuliferus]